MTEQKYKKYAFFLALLLLLTALASALWIGHILSGKSTSKENALIADIYQNGILLKSIRLDTTDHSYTITVTGTDGAENIIEVRPGSIGICSASCPDQLCVRQGFIHSSTLPIVCLPNRLVIQLRSNNDAADSFSY